MSEKPQTPERGSVRLSDSASKSLSAKEKLISVFTFIKFKKKKFSFFYVFLMRFQLSYQFVAKTFLKIHKVCIFI